MSVVGVRGADGEAFGLEEEVPSPSRLLLEYSVLDSVAEIDTKAAKITTPAAIPKLQRIVLVRDRLRRKCPQNGVVLISKSSSSLLLALVVSSISSSSLIMIEPIREMLIDLCLGYYQKIDCGLGGEKM